MAILSRLSPETPPRHLDAWQMDIVTAQVALPVTPTQAWVPCPICPVPIQVDESVPRSRAQHDQEVPA